MYIQQTLIPYDVIEYDGIQYSNCRDFGHISRYKSLRQVIHNPSTEERFVALETPNTITSNIDVDYYEVPAEEENRLDIIANKLLGSPTYSWVISYFNRIEDGYTVREGQTLVVPKSFSSLFTTGEILASVSPYALNLGEE